jgi:hypothetical protein
VTDQDHVREVLIFQDRGDIFDVGVEADLRRAEVRALPDRSMSARRLRVRRPAIGV